MGRMSVEAPSEGVVLVVDQGTTNTKAMLLRPATRKIVSSSSRPVGIDFPRPGWVEQDPEELWESTRAAVVECLAAAPQERPVGIALSTQRESVVAWSRKTGKPLGPVLGWQDARTAAWCSKASGAPGLMERVRERTGLSLDPMYSAPKLRWLIDRARAEVVDLAEISVGTVDAWLIWKLTGEHLIEAGNASRTLLFDLQALAWDAGMLDVFGVPESCLPEVRSSDAGFGSTLGESGFPRGLPVIAVLADSHAALFHHARAHPGAGKATYGTGSSVMAPCDGLTVAPPGVVTTLAWIVGDVPTYAREGNILASGSALDWMARTLGAPPGISGGEFLTELARSVADAGGVAFVPAFSGLGAPLWDRSATGLLTGIAGGASRAHLARAALEAVAHQVVDVVEAIEADQRAHMPILNADGGASGSGPLMQIQADLLERPVHISPEPEASAWGVALLAAQQLGLDVGPAPVATRIDPRLRDAKAQRHAWAQAVERSRGLAITTDNTD